MQNARQFRMLFQISVSSWTLYYIYFPYDNIKHVANRNTRHVYRWGDLKLIIVVVQMYDVNNSELSIA